MQKLVTKAVRNKAQPIYLGFSENEHESSIYNFKHLHEHDIDFLDKLKLAMYTLYLKVLAFETLLIIQLLILHGVPKSELENVLVVVDYSAF